MGFILEFAVKNLGRHLRRTLITAAALALGLAFFLLFDSMLKGADGDTERNMVWYDLGGARVLTPERAADADTVTLKHALTDAQSLAQAVRDQGWAATPRLAFEAELVATGESEVSRVVRARGIDPATDATVFPTREIEVTGRWFTDASPSVVLGQWLAEDLGVGVGQALTLTTRTQSGSFQVLDLEMVGTVLSPDPSLNRSGVFVPLALAQEQLEMPDGATEVAVGLPPGTDADALAQGLETQLREKGYDVGVLSWRDLAGPFLALTQAKQKGSGLVLFLVFVIAAVGVGNTMLLAFYERKTEIGMLRALGMSDRKLFWMFLTEAAGIGVIGSFFGLVLGALFVSLLVYVGIDFGFLIRQMDIGYRISGVMYGAWSPSTFVQAGVVGVLLAMACAIGPTRRALRLPITESLRAEG